MGLCLSHLQVEVKHVNGTFNAKQRDEQLNYQYPIPWAVFDGCVAKLYSFPVRKRGRSGRGSFCYSVFGGMGLSPCSK